MFKLGNFRVSALQLPEFPNQYADWRILGVEVYISQSCQVWKKKYQPPGLDSGQWSNLTQGSLSWFSSQFFDPLLRFTPSFLEMAVLSDSSNFLPVSLKPIKQKSEAVT